MIKRYIDLKKIRSFYYMKITKITQLNAQKIFIFL